MNEPYIDIMERYKNISGNSPVTYYLINNTSITVWFKGSTKTYTYSYYGGAGSMHVEQMKILARNGSGLSAYINRNVRDLYDK
jgi:hypothetical protein